MNIENITFGTIDADFSFETDKEKTVPIKQEVQTLKNSKDEASLEEVSLSDFDESINKREFQTKASNSSAGAILYAESDENEDLTFKNLLDFVQNNSDTIAEKLDVEKPTKDEVPDKPKIPDSFNLSDLSGLLDFELYNTFDFSNTDDDEQKGGKFNGNGVIENSKQGAVGDCWLLAGLNSLSYSEKGREIIKNSITNNQDGTYTVDFQGVGVKYLVKDELIEEARSLDYYSTGDDDVLIMEIATESFLKDLQSGDIDANDLPNDAPAFLYAEVGNPLDGGFPSDMVYLLTGKNMDYQSIVSGNSIMSGEELEEFYNKLDNFYTKFEQNPDTSCGCIHILKDDNAAVVVKDVNGNNVKLTDAGANHSWSVKQISGNTITMVNPWDSECEVTIEKSVLKEHVLGFEYLEM